MGFLENHCSLLQLVSPATSLLRYIVHASGSTLTAFKHVCRVKIEMLLIVRSKLGCTLHRRFGSDLLPFSYGTLPSLHPNCAVADTAR